MCVLSNFGIYGIKKMNGYLGLGIGKEKKK